MKKNFYFAVIFLLLAMTSFAQGPVVYLPLDNDLNDASGNGLHAADSGAVATAFVDDPERGRVAFFDSAAHAAISKDDILRFGTGDFSFAMWLKVDRVGGDPVIFGNKDWDSGRNKGFACYVKNANETGAGNFGINFSDGPEDQGGSHNRLYWETFPNGGPDVIDGAWHFVAASFDRDDTLRVWIDGEEIYSEIDLSITPGMAHDDVNDYPIRLMEDGTGSYNGDGLAGYMDEVRVWNRTLTNEEVQELFAPEEDDGPVVYLPLDNDLNDASGNGLHAADSGAVATVFVDDPERGRVAFFDSAAHAAISKDDILRFGTGDFSFAMWLKVDRVGGDPVIFGNKDWDSGRNKGFACYVKNANETGAGNFGINFSDGPEDQGGSHNRLYWEAFPNGAPDVVDGTWHSVAVSCDRDDTMRVWIDGVLQYSEIDMSITPGMAHDDVNDYPIRLMEDGTGNYNGDGLAGYMDEVRVWNRTLTDEEVQELYAPEEEDEGLVVYLPMDNDLNDASGNGLHAADSGAVATVFIDDPERGRVAFFEETAHAALPKDDALRFGTNDFAIAYWLKIDRVGDDPAIVSNKDWNNARNKGFVMYVDEALTPGEVNFGINLGDGRSEDGGSHTRFYWKAFENGAPDVIDGTWHFVAASFDRDDTLQVWIDGELQYSAINLSLAPGMAHDDVNDYPIRIMEDGTGKYNSTEIENGTEGLSGYIDEFRIWNRTVTNEEIVALYDQTNTAVTEITDASTGMLVYPNPATGTVNLLFNAKKAGMANIQLFNSTGMLVKEFTHSSINGQNTVTFSVKDWRPGMYLVRVISDSAPETVRLVVK